VKPRSLASATLHTFATLLFGQGASIAAGIATAHAFGPVGKGTIALTGVLLTFAVTTADGLKNAIAHQVGERRNARAVWNGALRLMALFGPLGAAIFACLYAWTREIAYLYVALAFPFSMYVQAVGIVYILRERVERINVKNALTIGGGYSLVVLIVVTVLHAGVNVVLALLVAAYVAAAVWSSFGLGAMLGTAGDRARPLVREQLAFVAKSSLSSNVTFLALRVDVFIVSALLGPASLGLYTLALATGEIMWQVSRSVIWSSSGRVAVLDPTASAALTARVVRSLLAIQLVTGSLLFACGPWLIAHVYGARFAESGTILRLLLPGVVLYSADGMLSYYIGVRLGRPGLLLGLETLTLAVCAGATVLLAGRYGLPGAAIADSIAYVLAFCVKVVLFARLGNVSLATIVVPRFDDVPLSVRLRLRRFAGAARADR
jgi:O-antigen/teichoic acid export membrane protein